MNYQWTFSTESLTMMMEGLYNRVITPEQAMEALYLMCEREYIALDEDGNVIQITEEEAFAHEDERHGSEATVYDQDEEA